MADEPKTFIVKRATKGLGWNRTIPNEFFVSGDNETILRIKGAATEWDADELEVTIRPRKSKRERRQEVFEQLFGPNFPTTVVDTALGMLEAIDKEFDGNA